MFLNALRNICRAFRPSLGLRLTWDTGLRFSIAALRLAQNPPKGTDTDTCRQTDTPTHTDRHRHTDGTPARSVHDPNTQAFCFVEGVGPLWGIAGFACKSPPALPSLFSLQQLFTAADELMQLDGW